MSLFGDKQEIKIEDHLYRMNFIYGLLFEAASVRIINNNSRLKFNYSYLRLSSSVLRRRSSILIGKRGYFEIRLYDV